MAKKSAAASAPGSNGAYQRQAWRRHGSGGYVLSATKAAITRQRQWRHGISGGEKYRSISVICAHNAHRARAQRASRWHRAGAACHAQQSCITRRLSRNITRSSASTRLSLNAQHRIARGCVAASRSKHRAARAISRHGWHRASAGMAAAAWRYGLRSGGVARKRQTAAWQTNEITISGNGGVSMAARNDVAASMTAWRMATRINGIGGSIGMASMASAAWQHRAIWRNSVSAARIAKTATISARRVSNQLGVTASAAAAMAASAAARGGISGSEKQHQQRIIGSGSGISV